MTTVLALWLPILLSGVAVYIVSSIIHMATPWHKGDYLKLPDEDRVLDALRPFALPPGDYSAPRAGSMQEMGTPEFVEKMKRGPVFMVTVMPSAPMAIGRSLAQWFVYSLVVAWFAAYTAGVAIPPGGDRLKVVQIAFTTAFAGYALGLWQIHIWYLRSLVATVKSTIDGVIYAALTAGLLAWLWPGA